MLSNEQQWLPERTEFEPDMNTLGETAQVLYKGSEYEDPFKMKISRLASSRVLVATAALYASSNMLQLQAAQWSGCSSRMLAV